MKRSEAVKNTMHYYLDVPILCSIGKIPAAPTYFALSNVLDAHRVLEIAQKTVEVVNELRIG